MDAIVQIHLNRKRTILCIAYAAECGLTCHILYLLRSAVQSNSSSFNEETCEIDVSASITVPTGVNRSYRVSLLNATPAFDKANNPGGSTAEDRYVELSNPAISGSPKLIIQGDEGHGNMMIDGISAKSIKIPNVMPPIGTMFWYDRTEN